MFPGFDSIYYLQQSAHERDFHASLEGEPPHTELLCAVSGSLKGP